MLREQGPLLDTERRGRDWPLPMESKRKISLSFGCCVYFICLFIVESSNIINNVKKISIFILCIDICLILVHVWMGVC